MIWVMLGLLLATMLIGIPILLCIALIGFIGIAAEPGVVMPMFAQKSFAQLDSYTLLALPFFILAGALMTAGGMSQQLVDFSRVLVGHLRAGLAHASVVCSMILSGVSGSSTADASAIASVLVPTMKQNGYKAGFAAALIACAGTIGAIIPPSMTMVVYGAIAQVSIGGLFLGGILPGLLVGFFLMAVVKMYTYHPDYPELRVTHGKFEWAPVGRSLLEVWPALLGPLVILGGILGGIFTATEAGVVACLYGFVVGYFYYRKIRLRDLKGIFIDATITTTMVSAVIAVSGAMGWLLAYMQFNDMAHCVGDHGVAEPARGAERVLGGDDHPWHLRRFAGDPAGVRAGRGRAVQALRHRSDPHGPGDGDLQPDWRGVAADRAASLRHHEHRAHHVRRHHAPRLAVLLRRMPGAGGGDLRSRPVDLDPALLPGMSLFHGNCAGPAWRASR